jgi:hypothetical protein
VLNNRKSEVKVHIETLRDHEDVRRILLAHGWRLYRASGPAYSARHPKVNDQMAARDRLNDLGLLTSSAVRIQFGPHAN